MSNTWDELNIKFEAFKKEQLLIQERKLKAMKFLTNLYPRRYQITTSTISGRFFSILYEKKLLSRKAIDMCYFDPSCQDLL